MYGGGFSEIVLYSRVNCERGQRRFHDAIIKHSRRTRFCAALVAIATGGVDDVACWLAQGRITSSPKEARGSRKGMKRRLSEPIMLNLEHRCKTLERAQATERRGP